MTCDLDRPLLTDGMQFRFGLDDIFEPLGKQFPTVSPPGITIVKINLK